MRPTLCQDTDWPSGSGGRRRLTTEDGRAAQRRGWLGELVAAGLLTLKGYRILSRRHRSRSGEVDIIAVRGRRLAFVEVKQRSADGEAETATTAWQARRIGDAAEQWVWRHPAYRRHTLGLDVVALTPWRWPRHLRDVLHPG